MEGQLEVGRGRETERGGGLQRKKREDSKREGGVREDSERERQGDKDYKKK